MMKRKPEAGVTSTAAQKRLASLLATLRGRKRLLILTHDNPDPDAIASGWGLLRVVRRLRGLRAELAYGGVIGRGENRTLCQSLRVPLRPLAELDLDAFDAIALVDSQPETGNNSLPKDLRPTVVLDHHPCRQGTRRVPYFDVREDYGATASIVTEYLLASGVALDRRLSTAIFYAIKSETQNLGREASPADRRAYLHFFPRVDNLALSRIEHPPIPAAHFSMIEKMIEGTRVHGPLVITMLGEVSHPDAVAEFADLVVRLERAVWALAVGRYGGDLLLSIRTNNAHANAGRIIQRIVGRAGSSGGHGMMAGGKLPGAAETPERALASERLLRSRALRVIHAPEKGVRLTPTKVPR